MGIYANDFRAVFWWAVVPAAIAMLLMVYGVQEPPGTKPSGKKGWPIKRADMKRMSPAYWWAVAIGAAITLAVDRRRSGTP